jgi:hypothetical protein
MRNIPLIAVSQKFDITAFALSRAIVLRHPSRLCAIQVRAQAAFWASNGHGDHTNEE